MCRSHSLHDLFIKDFFDKQFYDIPHYNHTDHIAHHYAQQSMEQMRHRKEEVLIEAFFDSKCHFKGDVVISKGSVNFAYVSPREIFRHAFAYDAVMFILLHNHPSGDPTPSEDDMRITYRINKGAQILELQLIDHIIIGDNQYYSFKEHEQI